MKEPIEALGATLKASATALVAMVVLATPGASHACSVCFSATEQNRMAFLITTGFLTVLPLLLIGSLVWWLRRRALEMERAEAEVGAAEAGL